ncbi:MAG: PRC-barrel domain-containing protein [Pontixanthobacter sp.]
MKKTILAASIFALTASVPAFAQQPTAPTSPTAPVEKIERPAESKPLDKATPAMKPAGETAATKSVAGKHAAANGDWRASTLIGASILNASNQSIGDINDLLLSKEGSVASVIVGVGGFLGIGEKNVALNFNELNISKDANGKTVVMSSATKESLESMSEWKAPQKL